MPKNPTPTSQETIKLDRLKKLANFLTKANPIPRSYFTGEQKDIKNYFSKYLNPPVVTDIESFERFDSEGKRQEDWKIVPEGLLEGASEEQKIAAKAQIDRILTIYATNIKSAALWQMSLRLAEKEGLLGDASELIQQYERSLNHEINRNSIRSFANSFIRDEFACSDPLHNLADKTSGLVFTKRADGEKSNNKGKVTWVNWESFTGDNAWALLLGPLQDLSIRKESQSLQKTLQDLEKISTCLDAFAQRQAPFGGFQFAQDNNLVTLESNFAMFSALRVLWRMINAQQVSTPALQEAKAKAEVMLYGGTIPPHKQTKGLISFLYNGAFNPEKGLFYESGNNEEPGNWEPYNLDDIAQTVMTTTAGISALGPNTIDEWYGKGQAMKMWQYVREFGGHTNKDGKLIGMGYTLNKSENIMSAEVTASAISAVESLLSYYRDEPETVSALKKDLASMKEGIEYLRHDQYDATQFGDDAACKKEHLPILPKDCLAYQETTKRYEFLGRTVHPLPSQAATSWALLAALNYNPLQYQGQLAQNPCPTPEQCDITNEKFPAIQAHLTKVKQEKSQKQSPVVASFKVPEATDDTPHSFEDNQKALVEFFRSKKVWGEGGIRSYYFGEKEEAVLYYGEYRKARPVSDYVSYENNEMKILPKQETPYEREAARAQTERTMLQHGINIYDLATVEISLGLAVNKGLMQEEEAKALINEFHDELDEPNRRAKFGQLSELAPQHSFVFRMYARNNEVSDPLRDYQTIDHEPMVTTVFTGANDSNITNQRFRGVTSWNDWRPVTGENAWALLIGPLQADLLIHNKVPKESNALKRAINSLDAFLALQTQCGGIYYAPKGLGDVPDSLISIENNFSALGGLQILKRVLEDIEEPTEEINIAKEKVKTLLEGGKNTKGLLAFFYEHAFDKKYGLFYTAGHFDRNVYNKRIWVPDKDFESNKDKVAVDATTWGICTLGPNTIDEWFGDGTAMEMWKKTKAHGGYFKNGKFLGVGYNFQNNAAANPENIMSAEWTAGAITAVQALIEYYQDKGEDTKDLEEDLKSMQEGIQLLRDDRYPSAEFNDSVPSEYVPSLPKGCHAYLYASKYHHVSKFSLVAQPIPNLASTGWALMKNYGYNPFQYKGKLVQKEPLPCPKKAVKAAERVLTPTIVSRASFSSPEEVSPSIIFGFMEKAAVIGVGLLIAAVAIAIVILTAGTAALGLGVGVGIAAGVVGSGATAVGIFKSKSQSDIDDKNEPQPLKPNTD